MGYYMDEVECRFNIKRENFDKALEAIKSLAGKETIHDSGGAHYSWVSNDFCASQTLKEAFDYWRWAVDYTDNGDVTAISFQGQKLGDDKVLFDAVAPFVENGSFIEMQGEDGTRWKWLFDGQTCKEKMGRIVYDEDEDG